MRQEDYDVTDLLAGILDLTESMEEIDEESEVMFDDESFFEPVSQEPSHDVSQKSTQRVKRE